VNKVKVKMDLIPLSRQRMCMLYFAILVFVEKNLIHRLNETNLY